METQVVMLFFVGFACGTLSMLPLVWWVDRKRMWWSDQASIWLRRTVDLELRLLANKRPAPSDDSEDCADWWKK